MFIVLLPYVITFFLNTAEFLPSYVEQIPGQFYCQNSTIYIFMPTSSFNQWIGLKPNLLFFVRSSHYREYPPKNPI